MHTAWLLVVAAWAAGHARIAGAATAPETSSYISASALAHVEAISSPPKPQSATDRADLSALLTFQASRTAADCERAASEAHPTLEAFFGPPQGPLGKREIAALAPFFARVRADTDRVVQELKARWKRPRPYQAHAEVHPCVPKETTGAYPSGHAAIVTVFARILADLYPARKAQILARAEQVGQDRILGGVHHPSDIDAGNRLGDRIYRAMSHSKGFAKDFEAALESVRKAAR